MPGPEGDSRVARPSDGHVQSLVRAFAVLKCFDAENPTLTIAEAAERSGLDRAAARRYLLTLQSLSYVGAHGGRFFLRPRLLELGYRYLAAIGIPEQAQPHLARLTSHVAESSAVTVLDGTDVVYVAVANAERALSIRLSVGNRLPACHTAMGSVLLSGLPPPDVRDLLEASPRVAHTPSTTTDIEALAARIDATRRDGWSVIDQEMERGVRSVAVPIRDVQGDIVAAGSLSAPAARVPLPVLWGKFLGELRQTVDAIEGQFGEP